LQFAKKAEALVPQLNDWIEAPLEVISFHPDPEAYFKCRAVHRCSITELSAKSLGKGDEVILDFGSHRVGYFSFYVGADGVSIDAPVRLKLTFGEIPMTFWKNSILAIPGSAQVGSQKKSFMWIGFQQTCQCRAGIHFAMSNSKP
jgi:hypothetical protein